MEENVYKIENLIKIFNSLLTDFSPVKLLRCKLNEKVRVFHIISANIRVVF